MDKRAKAGYIMTADDAIKFWERCQEAEKALGEKLTSDEREKLLRSMSLGKEVSLEELLELMRDKKSLIIKDGNKDAGV